MTACYFIQVKSASLRDAGYQRVCYTPTLRSLCGVIEIMCLRHILNKEFCNSVKKSYFCKEICDTIGVLVNVAG